MIATLKKLIRRITTADIQELIAEGAQLIDVRTRGEYELGHLKGAINIPLDLLKIKMATLPRDRAIVTCCASGMRSASARAILIAAGFTEVYDGGNWQALR